MRVVNMTKKAWIITSQVPVNSNHFYSTAWRMKDTHIHMKRVSVPFHERDQRGTKLRLERRKSVELILSQALLVTLQQLRQTCAVRLL